MKCLAAIDKIVCAGVPGDCVHLKSKASEKPVALGVFWMSAILTGMERYALDNETASVMG